MALATIERPPQGLDDPEGRRLLDGYIERQRVNSAAAFLFGSYALTNFRLLDTPPEVVAAGESLTNSSHIIRVPRTTMRGDTVFDEVAWFRREPTSLHLGKSVCAPYRLVRSRDGTIQLEAYDDAPILPGEDLRSFDDFPLAGHLGRVHRGRLLSVVVATPKPDDPAEVQSICQEFHLVTSPGKAEKVHEIAGLKNTIVFPKNAYPQDTSVGFFGRPAPHVTYGEVGKLTDITPQKVNEATVLTQPFMPSNMKIHFGVNMAYILDGNPSQILLNAHVAYAPKYDDAQYLHYDLINFGFVGGKLLWLGRTASRSMFNWAEPKPPENGVASYYDVTYGSPGPPPQLVGDRLPVVIGLSDRHIGYAENMRLL